MRRILLFALFCFLSIQFVNAQYNNLSVNNPQFWWSNEPGSIDEATFTIKPKGVYMEVGMYLTFSARGLNFQNQDTLEVVLDFSLPEEALVIDSWLWIDDLIIKAFIWDRWTASSVYEEIVGRNQDPSVLFKDGPTQYQLRIFPMAGDESRKVKITYLVPTDWSVDNVTAVLPTNILGTSWRNISRVNLRTWLGDWEEPSILEFSQLDFVERNDPELGTFHELELDHALWSQGLTFSLKAPLKNGVYVSSFEGTDDIYQMAFLPKEALDLDNLKPKRVMVLVDYDSNNSYDVSSQQSLLAQLKAQLKQQLTDQDFFNLAYTNLDINAVSSEWIPADDASIDATFDALGDDPIATYDNLPSLIFEGIQFIQSQDKTASILLVTNTQGYPIPESANPLLSDLMEARGENDFPINVAYYQNSNWDWYWVNNQNYRGNQYFLDNLSRLTGGDYLSVLDCCTGFGDVLAESFESVTAFRGTFDMHTTLAEGLCYNRYNIGQSGDLIDLNKPILQVGKYAGELPFVIEAAAVVEGELLTNVFEIPVEQLVEEDSLTQDMWSGQLLKELEEQEPNNSTITDIVNISIEERVLSRYTSFICLEPSQGGEPCDDCVDEDEVIVGTDDVIDENGLISIIASPNPFREKTTITMTFGEAVDPSDFSFAVFNAMGQQMATLSTNQLLSNEELTVEWDPSIQDIPGGIYFFVAQTEEHRFNYKLVYLK